LISLDASFSIHGPKGSHGLTAAEFFTLPRDPAIPRPGTRSTYQKVLDREAWTHAVVSAAVVLEMDQQVCKSASIVLGVAPIPWRLPKVEALLAGKTITPELAAQAGELAVEGANPLAKNKYKVRLTKAVVRRTVLDLATPA